MLLARRSSIANLGLLAIKSDLLVETDARPTALSGQVASRMAGSDRSAKSDDVP